MAADFVAEVIGDWPATSNLAYAHAMAGEQMDPHPYPVDHDQGNHSHQGVYQGWT
jgi:hypothetical protein